MLLHLTFNILLFVACGPNTAELMFVLDQYNSSDGGVMFDYSSGTNYDTIGLTNTAYSMSNSRQLIDIMNK